MTILLTLNNYPISLITILILTLITSHTNMPSGGGGKKMDDEVCVGSSLSSSGMPSGIVVASSVPCGTLDGGGCVHSSVVKSMIVSFSLVLIINW